MRFCVTTCFLSILALHVGPFAIAQTTKAQTPGATQTPGTPELGNQAAAARYLDRTSGVSVEQITTGALARNAQLLAARQRLNEAQGLLLQSGFRPNPSIVASYGAGSLLGSQGEKQFTLAYNHLFELGGKRAARVNVAQLGAELARFEIADLERQVRGDLRARYGEALAAVRNLEVAETLLDLNQQTFRITLARVEQGEAAPLERGLLQVDVGRLQSDRTLFENQVERALFEVRLLAGLPQGEPLRLNGDLNPAPVAITLESALARAVTERPDLRAARVSEQLAEAEIQLARTEAVPNLVGTGQYSRTNSAFDQFGLNSAGGRAAIRDLDNIATVGVSINLPFRNRNQGNIQAAVARREAAQARRQFVEQSVAREVRSAVSRYQAAQRSLAIFDQRVLSQAQENVRIIREAYNAGELRLFDVLNEQRRLIDTQRAYTEVLREYYLSLVELERALAAPVQ